MGGKYYKSGKIVKKTFTPVAMVKFCKRFNAKRLARINERILLAEAEQQAAEKAETKKSLEQDDFRRDKGNIGFRFRQRLGASRVFFIFLGRNLF